MTHRVAGDESDADRATLCRQNAEMAMEIVELRAQLAEKEAAKVSMSDHLTSVVQQISEGIILTDAEGRILMLNDVAVELHGVKVLGTAPDDYSAIYQLFKVDGSPYPADELPLARAVRHEETTTEQRWRILRPDGTDVLVIGSAKPVYSAQGDRIGAVLAFRDDTQRRAAEVALALSESRLAAVLDNTQMSVFLLDPDQSCVFMNAAAEKLTGFALEELKGRNLYDVVNRTGQDGQRPPHGGHVEQALPSERQIQGEDVFRHKNGHLIPVAFSARPIRSDAFNTMGTVLEVRDISAEKEAAERLRLLNDEMDHRVKNTLAMVRAIVLQAVRGHDVPREITQSIEARLTALARSHALLTQQSWSSTPITEVVHTSLEPFRSAEQPASRFRIDGHEVDLHPKAAFALALAFHELATNAVKYGALSVETGAVNLRWRVTGRKNLEFVWREQDGPPVEHPEKRGFGSSLIEAGITHDLRGGSARLEFAPAGVICYISLPLDALEA